MRNASAETVFLMVENDKCYCLELSGSISTDWKEWDELGKHAGCLLTALGLEGGKEGVTTENSFQGWPGPLHGGERAARTRFYTGARKQKAIRRWAPSISAECVCNLLL